MLKFLLQGCACEKCPDCLMFQVTLARTRAKMKKKRGAGGGASSFLLGYFVLTSDLKVAEFCKALLRTDVSPEAS